MTRLIADFANLNLTNQISVIFLFIVLLILAFSIPVLSIKKKMKDK